jgi:secondary thiamine-phosphate synthase enzyme
MKIFQKQITLEKQKRGCHLITDRIIRSFPEIAEIEKGILLVFIKHTSAGLTINENADPSVRSDFASYFDRAVPENAPYFRHNDEGDDDMPAHIKSSLIGSQVSIPITEGRLNLGTWQGIYLCEFRNNGGNRNLVLTAYGI